MLTSLPAVVVVCAILSPTAIEDEKGYVGLQLKKVDNGLEIVAVIGDGPGDKAGLKKDDLIIKMDGDEVNDLHTFVNQIGDKKPGTKIKFTIHREGKEKVIEVTAGKRPDPS